MHSYKQDIDIRGMIIAERKSAPGILTPVKEALHNSLEAIRLARLLDANTEGIIDLTFYIRNKYLEKWCVFDQATKNTGIQNLESKQMYKLYKHEGTQSGFSEYGIGSKLENLRCCDLIQHHTITDSESYEHTSWHVPRSIETNSLLDVIEYRKDPDYQPMRKLFDEGFKTGTLLECSGILQRLQNIYTAEYIITSLCEDISYSLVKFDEKIQIFYKVFVDGNLRTDEQIISKDYLYGYRELHDLICCEDRKIREQETFIKINQESKKIAGFESILTNEITNQSIKDTDVFISYYEGQKIDHLGSDKPKIRITGKEIKIKYAIKSHIKLICSTAEYKEANEEFGFYGFREVEGENIVCTTPKPLLLQWNKLKSHKTRHMQLRVGIQYDRKSDGLLLSDKSKTLSDDRDIEPSLRYNILKLTDMYISKMRKDHKFYNTDIDKREPVPVPPIQKVPQIEFIESDSSDEESESSEEQQFQQTIIASIPDTSSDEDSESVTMQDQQFQQTIIASSDEDSDSESVRMQEQQFKQSIIASNPDTSSDEDSDSESVTMQDQQLQQSIIVGDQNSGELLNNITEYTSGEQKRMHVSAEIAIECLEIIKLNYQKNNLTSESTNLLVKIACNLLGKGGCQITELFIKDIPFDKLYTNIKIIWSEESKSPSSIKMGSEIVSFVKTYNL